MPVVPEKVMNAPVGAANQQRSRILVVDDEPYLVAMCKRVLHRDYDLLTFTDPSLALDAAISGDFDLIISNMNMPHLSGHELFTRVCAACPAMADRFLFLTGGASATGDPAFDRELGRALHKPFYPAALLSSVRARLGDSAACGEPRKRK